MRDPWGNGLFHVLFCSSKIGVLHQKVKNMDGKCAVMRDKILRRTTNDSQVLTGPFKGSSGCGPVPSGA